MYGHIDSGLYPFKLPKKNSDVAIVPNIVASS